MPKKLVVLAGLMGALVVALDAVAGTLTLLGVGNSSGAPSCSTNLVFDHSVSCNMVALQMLAY
jgi:hypothetical protein